MKILFENEHALNSPSFIGTDAEKIAVLGYWAGMISHLRSMNMIVISHDNKLAIIAQLKKELELIDAEINNDSARPVVHPDGSLEMSNNPTIAPNMDDTPTVSPNEVVIDLTTESQFSPKIPVAEAMQRLAGTWYKNKASKK